MAVRGSGGGGGGEQQERTAALQQYEAFRRRLLADLQQAQQLRSALTQEEQQYADLQTNLAMLQREKLGELTALVPLGAGVQAQAAVPDTSRIFVHVALGFHPELTLEEAARAAALRREHLQYQVDARGAEVASIRAHLRLVEQALSDLAGLPSE